MFVTLIWCCGNAQGVDCVGLLYWLVLHALDSCVFMVYLMLDFGFELVWFYFSGWQPVWLLICMLWTFISVV